MKRRSDQAALLRQLSERAGMSADEREALRTAAELMHPLGQDPSESGTSRRADAPRRAVLWSDGAARGNPGPAGIGAVLKTVEGELLAQEAAYLGEATNNVAEYRALLLGLSLAREIGVEELEVRADSELLIKQLQGKYKVQSEKLKPLFRQAQDLIKTFRKVSLSHVRREYNREADELANQGIDDHFGA